MLFIAMYVCPPVSDSQILEYSRDCSKRDTIFDSVFKAALRELHTSLLTNLSISRQVSYPRRRWSYPRRQWSYPCRPWSYPLLVDKELHTSLLTNLTISELSRVAVRLFAGEPRGVELPPPDV